MRRRGRLGALGLVPLALVFAVSALAETLSSASFELRAGRPVAAGHAGLGPTARFTSMGFSLGQLGTVGYAGQAVGLETAASGFWPIVLGGFPDIDVDGDGIASFFDEDDDGDGLPDAVESGRGVFVSASDTGSSPVRADSDGDGVDDGIEVAKNTDPNDPLVFPPLAAVPVLGGAALGLLGGLLAWSAGARLRARRETG